MDRAPIEAFSKTKACKDCAHHIPDGMTGTFAQCGAAPKVDDVTGRPGFYQCATQRQGSCGAQAIHFTPSADHQAKRSVRRLQLARAIEDGITQLRPDPVDAADSIVAPLAAALKARYDERLPDVQELLADLIKALHEADGVSDGFPA
jgi:hypothetical protein